eukprot:351775-Chlamydomonas_euryale.AAC.9
MVVASTGALASAADDGCACKQSLTAYIVERLAKAVSVSQSSPFVSLFEARKVVVESLTAPAVLSALQSCCMMDGTNRLRQAGHMRVAIGISSLHWTW